ncbi:helix-turn-helix domain-containing protein [Metabacillus bambusae]|uniref:Helix-turn-helix domain-containing protein n=1 Tax=Metabacillus bambusae TaxID=2795218 RepID=A0ABS3MZU3_9BACI|nr:helix-turn-helix transcriptional regulator [Metabacillus bambusae]MBO1511551.1 helix-turn-helix domain-containing protein [Metabacillus bambusae]
MAVTFYVDIDKILERRGMTLTQLADLAGIDKGNLSKIRSTKAITINTLNKLASALGETDPANLISVEVNKNQK